MWVVFRVLISIGFSFLIYEIVKGHLEVYYKYFDDISQAENAIIPLSLTWILTMIIADLYFLRIGFSLIMGIYMIYYIRKYQKEIYGGDTK